MHPPKDPWYLVGQRYANGGTADEESDPLSNPKWSVQLSILIHVSHKPTTITSYPVLVYTLEMCSDYSIIIHACRGSEQNTDFPRVKESDLGEKDWLGYTFAAINFEGSRLFLEDVPGWDVTFLDRPEILASRPRYLSSLVEAMKIKK